MKNCNSVGILFAVVLFLLPFHCSGSPPTDKNPYRTLGHYNVDDYMTVSGLSGGGSFSMMLSFIYSSFVKGAGIFAGGPMAVGLILIENTPQALNFTAYTVWIDYLASRGWIDDPSNMKSNLGAYVYHGKYDQLIPMFLSRINAAEFRHYGVRRVKEVIGVVPSGHCFPRKEKNDHYMCSIGWTAICSCEYAGVYEMFNHLYPNSFVWPDTNPGFAGDLFKFNQDDFFPGNNATQYGFAEFGWAYVPLRCQPTTGIKCKLHFMFHSCGVEFVYQLLQYIPDYIINVGYLEAADANDIIIVFPTAKIDTTFSTLNFLGCHDLYSYTSPFRILFTTKYGAQPLAVKRMFQRVLNGV